MSNIAIRIENVSKQYRLGLVSTKTLMGDLNRWWTMRIRGKEDPYLKIGDVNDRSSKAESDYVWALKDINMEIEQGDIVGIIGKNGAGKSTLLKLLSKVTKPTTGTIQYKGRISSLLEVGTGFHPELTGRENIYMNGAIMGMSRAEITKKLDEIIDFSGCERYIDTPVKRYSSGMTVRLGFAVAAHLEPDILVVDEVLAVGDAEFQKKAIGKMQNIGKGEGRTVLFVSHNMASIRALCEKGVLLEKGKIVYSGEIGDVVERYVSMSDADLSIRKRTWDIDESKPACITGIEIMVEGKTPDKMIDMTDKIKIGVDYYLKENMKNTSVAFSLFKEGVCLFMTWDTDLTPQFLETRERGYHRTEFNLPNSLKPGIYDIRMTFGVANIGSIDVKANSIQFEINNVNTEGNHRSFTRQGLVNFDIQWNEI